MLPSFRNKDFWNWFDSKVRDELKSFDVSDKKPYDAIILFSSWLSEIFDKYLKDFKPTSLEIKERNKE